MPRITTTNEVADMTLHARYIIVLDRMDDDDHCGTDGHEPVSDLEGMTQVAHELQEAMESTGEPAGFFNVIARYRVPSGGSNVADDEPLSLRKSVRKALKQLARDGRPN